MPQNGIKTQKPQTSKFNQQKLCFFGVAYIWSGINIIFCKRKKGKIYGTRDN